METEKTVSVAVRSRPTKGDELYNSGLIFSDREVAVQDKGFSFDYVFPPSSTNLQVYNTAVANRLSQIFEGYNLTVFAYGQTGSGKTYTMGTNYPPVLQNESGIIFLSVTRIFQDIKEREDDYKFTVNVSFLEVYKEDVYDLLSRDKKSRVCQIREDFDGVKVVNLTEVLVSSVEEVLSVLEQGCQARSTASTAMNEHSSRSHSLFILSIEQIHRENFETKKSKFQLVDLAGSERANQSKTEGIRFKEGVDINKGLLALGKVISALSEGKSHIPYRDSRLTRLLMDSLGGNSYTLMIACISPSVSNSDETISTLRYASRARKIKNRPIVNNDPPDIQIQKLKQQVELLQAQLYKRSCSFENISGMDDISDLKEKNSHLKNELSKSSIKLSMFKEKLIKEEKKIELMGKEVCTLHQKLQSCIDKCDDNSSSFSVADVLIHLKSVEEGFQDLIVKCNLATVTDNFEVPDPFLSGIVNTSSGSESSEGDELISDLEVTDIDRQIEKVELRLLKKQEMAQQFEVLTEAMESSSIQNLNALQERIDKLLKERKELELALKNSEKLLCEERNKRYNECQSEIKQLEKEILKSKFLKKVKEENKMKIELLQKEIQSLKTTKVKLQKKMKSENDNFRKLQMAKDREVEKLKKNERKKDFEILKLRNDFDKKVNALKRKIENVQSMNKRQSEALSRHKNSQLILKDRKIPKQNMEAWLMKEIEVVALKQMASIEYIAAKENMGLLTEEAHNIQNMSSEETNVASSNPLLLLKLEVEKLERQKPIQNDPTTGEKNLDRWRSINSMVDAKTALTLLFEKCIEDYVKLNYDNGTKPTTTQKDSRISKENFEQELKRITAQNRALKDKVIKLKKEKCEQDVKVFQHLKNMNDLEKYLIDLPPELDAEKIQDLFRNQKSELHQLTQQLEDCNTLKKEIEFWKEQCNKMQNSKKKRYMGAYVPSHQSVSSEVKNPTSMLYEYLEEELGDDSFQCLEDDSNHDPDWRATPVHKQRKRTIHSVNACNEISNSLVDNSEQPRKRSFTTNCACPGDCKTIRCACKKKMKTCDSACNCNRDCCVNILKENSSVLQA